MKSPASGSRVFFHAECQADKHTDMTEQTVAFRNFANANKI